MRTMRMLAAAMVIVGSSLAVYIAQAQQGGIKRTDLQRHDLSAPGREVIQVRAELAPGVAFGKHWHPGEEIIYVLDGSATFVTGGTVVEPKTTAPDEVRGSEIVHGETRTISKGDVLIVPAGTPHWFETVPSVFTYYVVKVRS